MVGRKSLVPLSLALLLAAHARVAMALDIEPSIRVGETYTSNVNLDDAEEDEWVTSVTPGVEIAYRGNALEVVLDYRLEALFYANESDRNEVFNQLEANTLLDLVGDALQFRARGTMSQVNVEPQESVASSNINVTGNRTDATSWNAGPEWRVPVFAGSVFDGFARYGQVLYDEEPRSDDETEQTTLEIQDVDRIEGRAALRSADDVSSLLTYALVYEFDQLDYGDAAPEAEQQAAYLRLNMRLSDYFSVFGLGGLDSDFEDPTDSSLEEGRWEAGLTAGTDQLQFEAAIGHRFFGSTTRVSLTQSSDSATYRLSYSEAPNTSDRVQLQRIEVDIPDPDAPPENPPPDTGIETPGQQTRFIQKRADASARWSFSRSSLGLSLFWDERQNQLQVTQETTPGEEVEFDSRDDESSYGVVGEFDWQLGTRSNLRLSTSWRQREYVTTLTSPEPPAEQAIDRDQVLTIAAGYDYLLGERTTLTGRAGFQSRAGARSDADSQGDYDEYWVGIDLERRF